MNKEDTSQHVPQDEAGGRLSVEEVPVAGVRRSSTVNIWNRPRLSLLKRLKHSGVERGGSFASPVLRKYSLGSKNCPKETLTVPKAPKAIDRNSNHLEPQTCVFNPNSILKNGNDSVNKPRPLQHSQSSTVRKSKRVSLLPSQNSPMSVQYAGAPRLSLSHVLVPITPEAEADVTVDEALIEPVNVASAVAGMSSKPRSSVYSLSPLRCRICLMEQGEEDEQEDLINPCRCKGTIGLLHTSCLREWLVSSNTNKCELCGYRYILKQNRFARRNTLRQNANALRVWLGSKISRRNIAADTLCTILLTIATVIIVYYCGCGIKYFHDTENVFAWQVFGMCIVIACMVSGLIAWIVVASRYHLNEYRQVRRARQLALQLEGERDQLRDCIIMPRPRGSSVIMKLATAFPSQTTPVPGPAEPVMGLMMENRKTALEPLTEVTEMSFVSVDSSHDHLANCNTCSPCHHTRNNISVHSTDIIL